MIILSLFQTTIKHPPFLAWIFTYKGYPQNTTLSPGRYKLRVWGAQGGFIDNSSSGLGSYTEGILKVSVSTKLSIYVGQQGQCSNPPIRNTFFQGGLNSIGPNENRISCTGGGATFISSYYNLSDILIISGSGGGSGYWNIEYPGGYGGLIAGNGIGEIRNSYIFYGTGATNQNPGIGGRFPGQPNTCSSCVAKNGNFLQGGNACSSCCAATGGGGSGYYGGGGGADNAGGGGGSSYAKNILQNIIYKNGNENITEPDRTKREGHAGDGLISIEQTNFETLVANFICHHFNFIISITFILLLS
ncbi:hypothetical protein TVAG_429290 [Trichomonas vaginalis G3]|uniref:receptor protein-tyrosine kinase n=1 Tax=Trichomonas vaginalis (strain ATCC PRA-98 / G3) TaxID=412133 RepID=A2F947_TRIV3|nr:glycine-rich protein family [Trichomonas vaginalis G3]EAX98575.1 hypothetical protein TVAG_429290 [Trichomonas vaginalis G3]KAI5505226.1 glycine-rich protein family [Trichomonas vaginalis G3]|eukprot:XP_001311505.1 hypothetical protein [Trichomonas vaginalis G3]